jgi:hypothetical protein
MFYNQNPGTDLRFGDIVKGFVVAAPTFRIPSSDDPPVWHLKVTQARYLVVLSPCCSIERGCVLLAPLQRIRPAFLTNPYLAEDLERINRPVPADKTLAPSAWSALPEAERAKRLAAGDGFIVMDCFVYGPNAQLGSYVLHAKSGASDQSHYLVDFGTTFRVECDAIARGRPAPSGTKLLELSISTRKWLRTKIAAYYARIPEEDIIGVNG